MPFVPIQDSTCLYRESLSSRLWSRDPFNFTPLAAKEKKNAPPHTPSTSFHSPPDLYRTYPSILVPGSPLPSTAQLVITTLSRSFLVPLPFPLSRLSRAVHSVRTNTKHHKLAFHDIDRLLPLRLSYYQPFPLTSSPRTRFTCASGSPVRSFRRSRSLRLAKSLFLSPCRVYSHSVRNRDGRL